VLNKLKNVMINENYLYLGDRKVEVKKLTPTLWKKLFSTIDQLPGLIVQVLLAPKENFYSYVVQACDLALDEVIQVVAVLSDIDAEYISDNAGLDEIINYLVKTVKKNNLRDVVKNVQSLLPQKTEM
jgi:hypothetical protein